MSERPPPAYGRPGQPPRGPERDWVATVVGFLLGVVSGVGVPIVIGVALFTVVDSAAWFVVIFLAPLLLPLLLLASPRSRTWGVWMLIGTAVDVIVLGGTCVAFLATFNPG